MPGNKVVKIILSEPMFDRIAAAAALRDQSVSEFMRSAVRDELTDMEARAKGAKQTNNLIRAIATAAHDAGLLGQDLSSFEPKGGE